MGLGSNAGFCSPPLRGGSLSMQSSDGPDFFTPRRRFAAARISRLALRKGWTRLLYALPPLRGPYLSVAAPRPRGHRLGR